MATAEGLALGQGGSDGVELGRAGEIIKPNALPTSPQVVRRPTFYTVEEGEDLAAIAGKFNLGVDQLRWSNPRPSGAGGVSPGDRLVVPPIAGVVVPAKEGDSAASIATTYHGDLQRLIDFNSLRDPDHLKAGELVVVPDGYGPALQPGRASAEPPHLGRFPNGRFFYGYCTWYVASRRDVPWSGDAWQWFGNARAMGFATGRTPKPGAIMVTMESWIGHVAYVEEVNADGSFVVSEMNYRGWNVLSTRSIRSAATVPLLGFIY